MAEEMRARTDGGDAKRKLALQMLSEAMAVATVTAPAPST